MKKLNKLIVIRHGDYNKSTGQINDYGIEKITKLIPYIKDKIGEEKVLLLSSSSLRAEGSMKIISESLNLPYETSDFLRSDDRIEDFISATRFLESKTQDHKTAIIVTHLEYANFLPFVLFRLWEINDFIDDDYQLEKGGMLFLDFEKEELEFIP